MIKKRYKQKTQLLIKKIKDNKGMSFINKAVMLFVLFIITFVAIDLILFAYSYISCCQQTNFLATKLSLQGGFIGTYDSNTMWMSNKQIYNYLNDGFASKIGSKNNAYKWGLEIRKKNGDTWGDWKSVIKDGKLSDASYKTQAAKTGLSSTGDYTIASGFGDTYQIRLSYVYSFRFSGATFGLSKHTLGDKAIFRIEYGRQSF